MNTGRILLAYATRYGSTQEVAEAITATLRDGDLEVDIRPMREVETLDGYEAIVLGAAIYNARWHPDAHRFLSLHREALRDRPVAIFALGPLSPSEAAMVRSRGQLDKELRRYPWLRPAAREVFGGAMDPSKLGFFQRARPASDLRDWDAIHGWGRALPAHLLKVEVPDPA